MKRIFKKKTVIVGLSGGVDSSVTAALLKKQGFNVIGVFMKNWSEDFGDYGCTWAQDSEDARKVAQVLNIPFYVWNFEKEYYDKVVEYFFREYKAGRTPNPDVMCNTEIKFKVFLEKALKLGADFVATGHYARVKHYSLPTTHYKLLKGVDPAKDQSYFLYTLKQSQLAKILFPIGGMKKSEVRVLAKKFKLPNAEKKDSQGICFIGKVELARFLQEYIKPKKGDVITIDGKKIGEHNGVFYYTIGQRHGLDLGSHTGTEAYYIAEKRLKDNVIVVAKRKDNPALFTKALMCGKVNWINSPVETQNFVSLHCTAKIRYRQEDQECTIKKVKSQKSKVKSNVYHIVFKHPQWAAAPGQSIVFYNGEECLGGGVILSSK